MKRLARIPGLKIWTMLLLLAGTLGSCNILDEEDEDCAVYIRFKYDMNMLNADAFSTNVKSLTLYVFKDGKLAYQKTEEGSLLEREGYRMRLDEIPYKQKHEYDYIVWAGVPDNNAFAVPTLVPGDPKEKLFRQIDRLQSRDGSAASEVNMNLQGLYHGMVEGASMSRAASSVAADEVLVPLTKNTNTVRIIMQHLSGEPINVDDFKYTITDANNGYMNYDNTLDPEKDAEEYGEPLVYSAWQTRSGTTGNVVDATGVTSINVAVAEISLARLMATEKPRLIITSNETGEEVLNISLVDYALMIKGNYESEPQFGYEMPDQEYLDREDEYTMIFFLDNGNRWVNTFIYINSWKVVLQDTEL